MVGSRARRISRSERCELLEGIPSDGAPMWTTSAVPSMQSTGNDLRHAAEGSRAGLCLQL